eukprot:1141113-Pelagomonas_calceolata.AAC.3
MHAQVPDCLMAEQHQHVQRLATGVSAHVRMNACDNGAPSKTQFKCALHLCEQAQQVEAHGLPVGASHACTPCSICAPRRVLSTSNCGHYCLYSKVARREILRYPSSPAGKGKYKTGNNSCCGMNIMNELPETFKTTNLSQTQHIHHTRLPP